MIVVLKIYSDIPFVTESFGFYVLSPNNCLFISHPVQFVFETSLNSVQKALTKKIADIRNFQDVNSDYKKYFLKNLFVDEKITEFQFVNII